MPDLSALANELDVRHFDAGHKFLSVGDNGEEMYVVSAGEVEIKLRGNLFETVEQGGIFGEMALIDRRECSAEVVAKTDVEVGVIDAERFADLVRNHPTFGLES